MSHPKVSVITPSLNQGQFIERTILSVENQDYPNIEHIVIDGGSTDNTLSILRKYEDSIIWKSEPDKGQSEAINKGFLLSTGEIVAWLNSDDTYQPTAVRRAVDFLSEHPDVRMVYGDCRMIDEKDEVIGRWVDSLDFDLDLLTNKALNFIPQPTVFFKRQVLDTVGLLDVDLQMAMDYDYWIRIGQRFKVRRIPRVLADFRLSSSTKSVANWSRFWPEILSILIKHCGVKPLPCYFKRYYRVAREHGCDSRRALATLEQAILGNPWLEPYRDVIRVKGLSQALMGGAHQEYLLNRRRCGLGDLGLILRTDPSLAGSREFLVLGAKLILGRRIIGKLKSWTTILPSFDSDAARNQG